jgi:hypothetical protein
MNDNDPEACFSRAEVRKVKKRLAERSEWENERKMSALSEVLFACH